MSGRKSANILVPDPPNYALLGHPERFCGHSNGRSLGQFAARPPSSKRIDVNLDSNPYAKAKGKRLRLGESR